jgi:hypothetical protein
VLLEHFIRGVGFAASVQRTGKSNIRFSSWIAGKYRFSLSRSAFSVIALISDSQEHAFENYFLELDAFHKECGALAEEWKLHPLERDFPSSIYIIERKLGEVLSCSSVRYLRSFLNGYDLGCKLCSTTGYLDNWQVAFEQWIARRKSWSRTYRWDQALTFLCGGNEAKACDKFFVLFRDFCLERGHSGYEEVTPYPTQAATKSLNENDANSKSWNCIPLEMNIKQLLQEVDVAIHSRNRELSALLCPGLPRETLARQLKNVPGAKESLLDLFSWHNGTDPEREQIEERHVTSFQNLAIIPNELYVLPRIDLMLAHFGSFREVAKYNPKIAVAVERYFPILWNGSTSWLAIDLYEGCHNAVVFIDFESDEPILEAYPSLEAFLLDLITANKTDTTISYFAD